MKVLFVIYVFVLSFSVLGNEVSNNCSISLDRLTIPTISMYESRIYLKSHELYELKGILEKRGYDVVSSLGEDGYKNRFSINITDLHSKEISKGLFTRKDYVKASVQLSDHFILSSRYVNGTLRQLPTIHSIETKKLRDFCSSDWKYEFTGSGLCSSDDQEDLFREVKQAFKKLPKCKIRK